MGGAQQIDPTLLAIIVAALTWAATKLFEHMQAGNQKRNDWQDKLVFGALAAAGAYALRHLEARNERQDGQAVFLAAIEGKFEERFKTIFNTLDEVKVSVREALSEIRSHDRMSDILDRLGVAPPAPRKAN